MHNYKTFKQFLSEEEPVGDFRLNDRFLDTLENISIPRKVTGDFYCASNRLTSLQFGPTEVTGEYSCRANLLTSLKFAPIKVGADFYCSDNLHLTSLEGCPSEIGGMFHCKHNFKLTSLEGSPKKIGSYSITGCSSLTSLEGITPQINGNLDISNCKGLKSLKGIHKLFKGGFIKGTINATGTLIESHLLGLLLIPELDGIKEIAHCSDEFKAAANIINKHLDNDRDVIECQQELIEAGLKAYAQL